MSMLAERKRKTKWTLNPTKKPIWATDPNGINFGKRLMEKMGWSTGKGLGAQEQGIQEPLKVTYKNDTEGMGFKDNKEVWIEQQDEFNKLLNQLRGSNDCTEPKFVENKSVVKSLEEKSKQSKVRVHYHKFTRGKDLSRYSEDDLSCILGTKKIKKEKSENEEKLPGNTLEKSFGVTTINSGSIDDYFKKKRDLGEFKKIKSVEKYNNNEENDFNFIKGIDSIENDVNHKSYVSEENLQDEKTNINEMKDTNMELVKKSKKQKKKKSIEDEELLYEGEIIQKKKKITDEKDYIKYNIVNTDLSEEKGNNLEESTINITEDNLLVENYIKKCKKSKKKLKEKHIKQTNTEGDVFEEKVVAVDTENTNDTSVISESIMEVGDLVEKIKKNKRKKHKRKLSESGDAMNDLTENKTVDLESKIVVECSEITSVNKVKHKKKNKEKIRRDGSYFEEIKCDSVNICSSENHNCGKDIAFLDKSECTVNGEKVKQKKRCENSKEKIIDSIDQNMLLLISEKFEEERIPQDTNFKDEREETFIVENEDCVVKKEKKKKKNKEKKTEEEKNEKENDFAVEIIENSGLSSKESVSEEKKCHKSKKKVKDNQEIFEERNSDDSNEKNEKMKEKRKRKNCYFENPETHGKLPKCKTEKNIDEEVIEVDGNKGINMDFAKTTLELKVNDKKEMITNLNKINAENQRDVQNFKHSKNREYKKNAEKCIENLLNEKENGVIYSHKVSSLKKKIPTIQLQKKINYNTFLNLICGADLSKFKGSNLFNIPGYGLKKSSYKNKL